MKPSALMLMRPALLQSRARPVMFDNLITSNQRLAMSQQPGSLCARVSSLDPHPFLPYFPRTPAEQKSKKILGNSRSVLISATHKIAYPPEMKRKSSFHDSA